MTAGLPTRIAFAITELDIGGAERALVKLVLGLPREEWEPRVYCLGAWGPLATTLQEGGIEVRCLNAVHLWDAPRIWWRLVQELKEFQPALLQTFLFHANILGRLAAAWAGVKVVVSGVRVAERRGRWHGWIDRWTNPLVAMNVCVSRGVARYCAEQVGLDPRKLIVIPNGVEIGRFLDETPASRESLGMPLNGPLVLAAGRLEPQKGLDLLLAALPAVLAAEPDTRVLILGEGPDRAALEQQARELGVREHVTLPGHRSDVGRWLKAADIFVLPSRWEGMPNVVLEAMAAGVPVIATAVEGIEELIDSEVTGIVVPAGETGALAAAMIRLLRQSEKRSELALRAQSHVKERFTVEAVGAEYQRLYRRLLASQP